MTNATDYIFVSFRGKPSDEAPTYIGLFKDAELTTPTGVAFPAQALATAWERARATFNSAKAGNEDRDEELQVTIPFALAALTEETDSNLSTFASLEVERDGETINYKGLRATLTEDGAVSQEDAQSIIAYAAERATAGLSV